MSGVPPVYIVLDGASAVLTLTVAVGFWLIARWSRAALHYMVSAGFTLLAAGFLFVSVSHFRPELTADAADAVRIFCQLTGAFMLLLAYGTSHLADRVRWFVVLQASLAAVVALGLFFFWIVPPSGSLPPLPTYFAVAYALMSLSFLGCAALSGYGWHKRPTWGRAMVPLGFLCWTFSTYTWIFIILASEAEFLPVVYGWRFAAILLMLGAMVRRPGPPTRRASDAPP